MSNPYAGILLPAYPVVLARVVSLHVRAVSESMAAQALAEIHATATRDRRSIGQRCRHLCAQVGR